MRVFRRIQTTWLAGKAVLFPVITSRFARLSGLRRFFNAGALILVLGRISIVAPPAKSMPTLRPFATREIAPGMITISDMSKNR